MSGNISYSELRKSLKSSLDRVCEDHVPLRVKRQRGGDVVILSEEDYSAIEETVYLLRSSANARRIQESLTTDEGLTFEDVGDIADARAALVEPGDDILETLKGELKP